MKQRPASDLLFTHTHTHTEGREILRLYNVGAGGFTSAEANFICLRRFF